jgi:hypothetical protein
MLYEVLGDIWVVQRNPYLKTTCWTTQAPAAADRRAAPPPGEVEKRRTPAADAERDAMVGELLRWPRPRCSALPRHFDEVATAAQARSRRVLGRATAKDNIKFDGLSRVSHVTDATDWRVEVPLRGADARHRGRDGRLVKGCIELGLTIIPRGGGTGYTGGAVPLTWKSAVINTEKLER